jgi:hypothetical protein
MGMQLEYVNHFRDLEVYKRQPELAKEVWPRLANDALDFEP